MGLLFKISKKEFLSVRNKIFLERGCVELESNGFIKSPFVNSWFGINNMDDYTSWATKEEVAVNYAQIPGGNGVVITKVVDKSSTVRSPDMHTLKLKATGELVKEAEVLLRGNVNNAKIQKYSTND